MATGLRGDTDPERPGQRMPIGSRLIGSVGALALAVVLGACAAVVDPPLGSGPATVTPSRPAERASFPATGTVFESARYGYRLELPTGWTGTETPGTGGVHPDEPGVDTFRDNLGHILSVTSEATADPSAWTCAIALHLEHDHDLPVESTQNVTVGGRPARSFEHHLTISPYVIHYLTAEVVVDDRGLTFSLESTTKRDDEDRRILDNLMAEVELVPAS